MVQEVFTIDFDPGLVTPGSTLNGVINVDLQQAEKNVVERIVVRLVGDVRTMITWSDGTTTIMFTGKEPLFKLEKVVWTPDGLGPVPSHQPSIPFTFDMPNTPGLPPSFSYKPYGIASDVTAHVRYYVQVEGIRKGWYHKNYKLKKAFQFLPFDNTPPPPALTGGSFGPSFHKDKTIRQGLVFGGAAKVEAEVLLPNIPALPLFTVIPVFIKVRCESKPLHGSSASDPSAFKFPLPPTTAHGIELKHISHVKINAQGQKRNQKIDYGLVGGLGEPKEHSADWGKDVAVTVNEPTWVPEEKHGKKEGRWTQEVTFQTSIVFSCPPTIDDKLVTTSHSLVLHVPFPGVGNDLTVEAGPLVVTSGVHPQQSNHSHSLNLPPYYYDVVDEDDDGDTKEKE